MIKSKLFYSCGKLGHMMKECPNRRSQELRKDRVQANDTRE